MKREAELHPYPGLRPFERHESRIFFGRQQQVDDLLTRLKEHHFLAVIGTSGSGKSSLIKAGLLPALSKGYMGEVGAEWSVAELRPGDQPFERLADALMGNISFRSVWHEAPFLAAELRRGSRSFDSVLEQSPLVRGNHLLLVVDQFEEIFRYRAKEENQATAFVSLLLEACKHKDIYVVITMRSDFLGNAAEFFGFPEAINKGLYLTPRLNREQLTRVITQPALLYGGKVDDELVSCLLNEVGNDPDQLPLLQHALMRLWGSSKDKGLLLESYQEQGGLWGALDEHAELAWAELDKTQQKIAEVVFRALTENSTDKKYTRRPVRVGELLELTQVDLLALSEVIDVFQKSERNFLITSQEKLTNETVVDIIHESLIRQWRRLSDLVDCEARQAEIYLRLVDAAKRYEKGQGELMHGVDLTLAKKWQNSFSYFWARRYTDEDDFYRSISYYFNSIEGEMDYPSSLAGQELWEDISYIVEKAIKVSANIRSTRDEIKNAVMHSFFVNDFADHINDIIDRSFDKKTNSSQEDLVFFTEIMVNKISKYYKNNRLGVNACREVLALAGDPQIASLLRYKSDPQEINIDSIVTRIIEENSSVIEYKGISFNIDLKALNNRCIFFEPELFFIVLRNFLLRSVNLCKPGTLVSICLKQEVSEGCFLEVSYLASGLNNKNDFNIGSSEESGDNYCESIYVVSQICKFILMTDFVFNEKKLNDEVSQCCVKLFLPNDKMIKK